MYVTMHMYTKAYVYTKAYPYVWCMHCVYTLCTTRVERNIVEHLNYEKTRDERKLSLESRQGISPDSRGYMKINMSINERWHRQHCKTTKLWTQEKKNNQQQLCCYDENTEVGENCGRKSVAAAGGISWECLA